MRIDPDDIIPVPLGIERGVLFQVFQEMARASSDPKNTFTALCYKHWRGIGGKFKSEVRP